MVRISSSSSLAAVAAVVVVDASTRHGYILEFVFCVAHVWVPGSDGRRREGGS